MIYLSKLWGLRKKNLILLDNEDILYHYHIMRGLNRQMKKDNIILEKNNDFNSESFTISKDYYKAIITIEKRVFKNNNARHGPKQVSGTRLQPWKRNACGQTSFPSW